MNKLRTALLGCGAASEYLHLPVLARIPEIDLVAIAEADESRRAEVHKRSPEVKLFASYSDLLREAAIDAAVIALPNHLHTEAALQCFAEDLHVYLEKPMATTLEDAAALAEAASAIKKTTMVGHNYRFGAAQREAYDGLRRNSIGRVLAVRSNFSTKLGDIPAWKKRRESGGGALLDLASHHIDLIMWLLDSKAQLVNSTLHSVHSEEDMSMTQIEFDNGVVASIMSSFGAGDEDKLEIYGEDGKYVIDRYRSDRLRLHPSGLDGVRARSATEAMGALLSPRYWRAKLSGAGTEESYQLALREFALSAIEGRPASPNFRDGLNCMSVLQAAEESARTGKKTSVDYR